MNMKMEEVVEQKWGSVWRGPKQLIGIEDKKCRGCKEIEMKDGKIEN